MESKSAASTFIETEELAELIKQKETASLDLIILNSTVAMNADEGDAIVNHNEKHIPGTQFIDLRYLRDASKPYPFMIPTEKHWKDYMRAHNIRLTSRIVIYDCKEGHQYFGSRAYFLFKAFGHKNVSILNGGFTKWLAEGRPTESSADVSSEADFDYKLNNDMIKSFEQIIELEKEPGET